MSIAAGSLAPFLAGILSHTAYFVHGEHHLYAVRYLSVFILVFSALTLWIYSHGQSLKLSLNQATGIGLEYFLGLYSSLVLYRIFFHRLNRFPGPFAARISGLWLSWRFRRRDGCFQLQKLHDRYGPIVRIGPAHLSISHPSAVEIVHGHASPCSKGPFYDSTKPMESLQAYRDKSLHSERRRVWSAAFSDRALRGYEQRLHKYRRQLLEHIKSLDGRPMNVCKWFTSYGFDFMGDLAFGKSFRMVESGEEHWAVKLIGDGMAILGYGLPEWLFIFLASIPGLAKGWFAMIDFAASQMEQRLKANIDIPDIISALAAPLKGQWPAECQMRVLRGDSQLIVAAGGDTTAVTLAALCYELLQHPEHVDKLRQELEPYVIDPNEEILNSQIMHLDHLNAVINETLRLHPPVPTFLQRQTPPQGITVEGVHIPGETLVWCSQYVVGRNEAAYTKPDQFVPERWYLHPVMVKDKTAFAPFSTGW
ncbi:hypothetical protein EYZ11_009626 [Aspergillus tanneri]|uniref:Cytochrome P450 n=1 Tax=Aspergillus tanneri TaxID=1220188 RepID=A0A4S3J7F6_9EURO|nr:hypothetical protein EYZ11_009626 [Aspergillus tanneri]